MQVNKLEKIILSEVNQSPKPNAAVLYHLLLLVRYLQIITGAVKQKALYEEVTEVNGENLGEGALIRKWEECNNGGG